MRLGLVAGGVGALAIVFAGGGLISIHLRARRAIESLAVQEAKLRSTPVTREPVVPTQPGTFVECDRSRAGDAPASDDCASEVAAGAPGVPSSCRSLMDDGNRWVDDWLRCSQRESIGTPTFDNPHRFGPSEEAGQWLGLHLRTLPVRQALDECRLAVAHARDQLWAAGATMCPTSAALLRPIVKTCQVASAEAAPDVRASYRDDIEHLEGQLPSNGWLGGTLEWVSLRELVAAQASAQRSWRERVGDDLVLPRTQKSWDEIVARQKPGAVHFDNTGGPMHFDAMIECDQLRDLLKAFPTSPKPAPP